ncbi:MAG: hypothetical protein IKD43_03125 [Clostridia bacterium]|nr:hypothetical protein [Clostridia bacterium]
MKRPSQSFEIALSAIACAVAAVSLTLGSYVDFLLAAGYLFAIFALMVPLSKDYLWGSLLAFVGASLLAFLFCGFAIFQVLPFLVFFGLHPMLNWLQSRYVKKFSLQVLCFFVKALWFDLAMWLMWAVVLVPIFGIESATWYPFVVQYFYFVLFIGGTVFFAAYDYMLFLCQRSVNLAVKRIRR